MQRCFIFTLVMAACSGAAPPPPTVQIAPPIDAAIVSDVALDAAPPTSARGGSCSETVTCAPGLACMAASLQAPGGYCASECSTCEDGACVPTTRFGAVCMQRCATSADCRANEGYVCDPQWRACVMPSSLVITLKTCPLTASIPTRDVAARGKVTTRGKAPIPVRSKTPSIPLRDKAFSAPTTLAARWPIAVLAPTLGHAPRQPVAPTGVLAPTGLAPTGVFALPANDTRAAPSLARDRKGILYAAWLDSTSEREARVWLARSRDGGATWSEPDRADDPADCVGVTSLGTTRECLGEPTVLVGANPESKGDEVVYVLYGASDGLRVRASRDEGATFRAAVTAMQGSVASAEVAVDGALHIVAIDSLAGIGGFGSANHRIHYTVSRDVGRTFAKPQRLDRRDEMLPVYFARPQIAIDTRRRMIYALYVRGGRDGVWDLMLLSSKDAGKTWKRTRIGDDCAIHMVPQLALDPTKGTLHVAWYDNRGGGRFAHASCANGTCKQLGAINDTPFVLTAERLTPTWIGERATLLVDDKRRTLHAVWAQAGIEGTTAVTRIQHAAAKLR